MTPPIKLLVTPHQFATKFQANRDKPYICARLYVRKVDGEGGFEIPCTISNPINAMQQQQEQQGGRLIKNKKIRRGLATAGKVSAAASLPVGYVNPAAGLALGSAGIAATELAGAGYDYEEEPAPKVTKRSRYVISKKKT